ncbi:hypothetical protein [Pedobacter arcticus]|uniref:hypothetical protein n=1 Tax=Pedobacter arcticus TaxID=752140 RepID=UPI00031342A2|nr:hypothetical protein [Pedobacter arcticus]
MENLTDESLASEYLKEFIEDFFASKLSTVEISYSQDIFIIDHKDALFIPPLEEYEKVINSPNKFDSSTIATHQMMLEGYIERVKYGHLQMLHTSLLVRIAQIKTVEVRIKGKVSFTISEQELNEMSN